MQTINGRTFASRTELIEHTNFSRATLAELWRHREVNGHPDAVTIDGVMHWDLEQWVAWNAELTRTRREQQRPVDRSGDPDEELRPAEQARVLGLDKSAISNYRKNPPQGWPDPIRTETTAGGQVREYRTRRQLWEYADTASRAGVGGRRAVAKPDPRVQLATEALAAAGGRSVGEIAAELAAAHGQSVHTWKRILAEVRKQQG